MAALFTNTPANRNAQLVTVGYGKTNFDTASATLTAFHVEGEFVRTLASKKLDKHGTTIHIPTSVSPDITGFLHQDSVFAPDGTVLCVTVSGKFKGAPMRDGAVFIHTRKEGPSLLISSILPSSMHSTLQSNRHTLFSGRGDILTVEELKELGIIPNKNWVAAYMNPEEVEECFAITVLAEAVAEKPRVERHVSSSGEEVSLVLRRQKRRMRL